MNHIEISFPTVERFFDYLEKRREFNQRIRSREARENEVEIWLDKKALEDEEFCETPEYAQLRLLLATDLTEERNWQEVRTIMYHVDKAFYEKNHPEERLKNALGLQV